MREEFHFFSFLFASRRIVNSLFSPIPYGIGLSGGTQLATFYSRIQAQSKDPFHPYPSRGLVFQLPESPETKPCRPVQHPSPRMIPADTSPWEMLILALGIWATRAGDSGASAVHRCR